jgi:deoxyadenosine/deoxycytidine kinase
MRVLLEGNIAAGKTTLGQQLVDSGLFAFIPEPVERWQTGFAANLLERFYTDTQRWAFTLQICAFVTRSQAIRTLPNHRHILFERSIYCDRHVFAKNLHQHGFMDDTEWALYSHFWEYFQESVPAPDAILYLRTPADECFRRLQLRGRAEEKGITVEYLRQLEARHNEWLLDGVTAEAPVIVLDGMQPWAAETVLEQLLQATQ